MNDAPLPVPGAVAAHSPIAEAVDKALHELPHPPDSEGRTAPLVLVLETGGALGAYQAGAYEALAETGMTPAWIAGTSIGALNAAVIAGNPPEQRVERLRAFWETISQPAFLPSTDGLERTAEFFGLAMPHFFGQFHALRSILEGRKGLYQPRLPLPAWLPGATVSVYDTSPLRDTLEEFADFDRINKGGVRLSIGAANARTGQAQFFDTALIELLPEHFMASCAQPPAFPAVEIGGKYFWDGGLSSYTPLEYVLESRPGPAMSVLHVDLWTGVGPMPVTVLDAEERKKDIRFASRNRHVVRQFELEQRYARLLERLLGRLQPGLPANDADLQEARAAIELTRCKLETLAYRDKEAGGPYKDHEFSERTVLSHWQAGLRDARARAADAAWLKPMQ